MTVSRDTQPHRPRRFRIQHLLLGLIAATSVLAPWSGNAEAAANGGIESRTLPCDLPTPFRRNAFTNSTRINNQWLPLMPGTQFTLQGRASNGGGPLPHTVILTVTDLYKIIDGVWTVVLWDRDFQDGELAEAELAFHAQDTAGNVWGLGEYPEEYEGGHFNGAPNVWISGQAGAQGGIATLAAPRRGTPIYLQGVAPEIDFLDCAQVLATGQRVCVPARCYDNVLVTDETSPLAGAAHQHKYYAPGVGNVKITAVDDPEGETLVLTSAIRLDARGLSEARKEALALDRHGYSVSPVYRRTAPAMPCLTPPNDPILAGRFNAAPWCVAR
jgi:hypothetical protein